MSKGWESKIGHAQFKPNSSCGDVVIVLFRLSYGRKVWFRNHKAGIKATQQLELYPHCLHILLGIEHRVITWSRWQALADTLSHCSKLSAVTWPESALESDNARSSLAVQGSRCSEREDTHALLSGTSSCRPDDLR